MKQVEKIWAELSAKAQEASKEVENTQEVELSEEQVELGAVEDAIKKTLDWYNAFYQGEDIYNFSLGQLNSYIKS